MDPPDITKYPHSLSGSDVMETIVPFTKSNNKVELSVKHVFHLLKLIRSSYLIVNNLFHVLKMIIRLSYFAPSNALFTLDQYVSVVQTSIDHD